MTEGKKNKRKSTKKKKKNPDVLSDLEILEELKNDILEKLKSSDYQARVADLLRILESKSKLKLSQDGKAKFWDLIEQIRKEELEGEAESEEE